MRCLARPQRHNAFSAIPSVRTRTCILLSNPVVAWTPRFISEKSIFIVIKQQVACELDTLIGGISLDEDDLRFIGACVVQALTILHSELKILYRNVEPMNLSVLENGYIALMDFR